MSIRRLHALEPREAAAAARRGEMLIVDVRDDVQAAGETIPGAMRLPLTQLEASLTSWRPRAPVVFVCRTGRLSAMSVKAARRAGLEAFFVNGGIHAWESAGLPLARPASGRRAAREVTAQEGWDDRAAHQIVDLRELIAFRTRRIPGSISIPLEQLPDRLVELEAAARPLLFVCGNGRRSRVAAELLERRGRLPVAYVAGGLIEWVAAELPLETGTG